MEILFVCTGNICRSPTAERLAAVYRDRHRLEGFSARSAGTRAVIGHPMHPESASVLKRLNGDPSSFVARQLTTKIASAADLILTMTSAHRGAVLELAPHRLHRTFTLVEASRLVSEHGASLADLAERRCLLTADEVFDVPDPIGQSPEVFAAIGEQIALLLSPILEIWKRSPSPNPSVQQPSHRRRQLE